MVTHIFYMFLLLAALLTGCSQTITDPGKSTVTLSGSVVLEGESDHSEVTVAVYKPVEQDTALVRINRQYPNIGVQISQQTEFFWRTQTPLYQTTTDAQGRWEIKNVPAGSYHLVYQKAGYGWQAQYQVSGSGPKTATMKKALIWQGAFNEAVSVPPNSFVAVQANTVFNQSLTVGAGTIIEFQNSASGNTQIKITVNGNLQINGTPEQPVYLVADDSSNADNIKVENTALTRINNCIVRQVKIPFHLNTISVVHVEQCRFDRAEIGLIISNSDSALLKNNVITGMALDGIQTFETHLNLQRNVIFDCANMGLSSKNGRNSIVKYNVFQKAGNYAVAVNLGGYSYTPNSGLNIINNDFYDNANHVALGIAGLIAANENNFLQVNGYSVWTNPQNGADTLNCKLNYWNSINSMEIYEKIYDKNDRLGQVHPGPVVDISGYQFEKIQWPATMKKE